ncbi:MAG: tetratricopeptide repeat protein, partial [Geminicoccaceae bacterium]|nr:tetratricopeptide repeat protein [Geminicoccaceae bacterium]
AASGAAGNYEEALYFAEQSLRANHRHASTIRTMIIANVELGRIPEARRLAAKLLMIEPDFSIRRYLDNHPSGRSGNAARRAQIFEKAGLPMFGPTASQHLRSKRETGEE